MAVPKTVLTKTVSINVKGTTVDDIVAAQTKVGAPSTASVTTGGNYNNQDPNPETALPHTLSFNWTEEVS